MNTYLIVSSLANCFTALLLLVFLFSSHLRTRVKQRYIYLMLSTAGWAGAYFLWRISETPYEAIIYSKLLMAFAIFSPIFFYHFSLDFSRESSRKLLYAGYIFCCGVLALTFTDQVVGGVSSKHGHVFWPDAGPLMWVYLLYFNIYLLASGWMLIRGWKENLGGRASDCLYIFFTGLIGFVGASTNFPLWFDIPIQPYGNILVSVYIIVLGYGIYSDKIFGVKLNVYKALVSFLLSFSFTIFYLLFYALYLTLSDGEISPIGFWLHSFFAFVVSTLVFWGVPRLKIGFEKMLDGVFRSEQTSALSELSDLPMRFADFTDEVAIAASTAECLRKTFDLQAVGVYRLNQHDSAYRCIACLGSGSDALQKYTIQTTDPLVEGLSRKPECLVLDQMYGEMNESYYQSLVLKRNDLKLSVVVPIFANHEILGFIFLGATNQPHSWTEQEVSILFNIGAQIGLNLRTRDLERRSNEVDKLVALGTMAAGLSHEIRNPLVSVQTLASLVKSGRTLDSVSADFKDVLLRDVKRIGNIVEGVALYSQNQESQKVPVSVDAVVQSSVEIYQSAIDQAGIQLDFDAGAQADIMVLAGMDQLMQVFNNLIENAVHALNSAKDPALKIQICPRRTRSHEQSSWVEVSISDNGSGIPESILARIFDPFTTSKDTGKREEKMGMGLGLAISKRIVDNHNGVISAANNSKGGAKFVVSLKVFDSKESDAPNQ
ncbi:MAG: ATP-binding protein [Opitutaceae bacterium]